MKLDKEGFRFQSPEGDSYLFYPTAWGRQYVLEKAARFQSPEGDSYLFYPKQGGGLSREILRFSPPKGIRTFSTRSR
jgi:hypothetical protein